MDLAFISAGDRTNCLRQVILQPAHLQGGRENSDAAAPTFFLPLNGQSQTDISFQVPLVELIKENGPDTGQVIPPGQLPQQQSLG